MFTAFKSQTRFDSVFFLLVADALSRTENLTELIMEAYWSLADVISVQPQGARDWRFQLKTLHDRFASPQSFRLTLTGQSKLRHLWALEGNPEPSVFGWRLTIFESPAIIPSLTVLRWTLPAPIPEEIFCGRQITHLHTRPKLLPPGVKHSVVVFRTDYLDKYLPEIFPNLQTLLCADLSLRRPSSVRDALPTN
jgi:hypothetical protein